MAERAKRSEQQDQEFGKIGEQITKIGDPIQNCY
jgi:hypothetical protein